MTYTISGLDDMKSILDKVAPKEARNLMRAAVQGVASAAAKHAKSLAPKDTGTLRKAIKAKRKKSHPDKPVSEVVVEHGAVKNDAFYWRFVEFGTGGQNPQPERKFMRPAREKAKKDFDQMLTTSFGKALEGAMKRAAKKGAK